MHKITDITPNFSDRMNDKNIKIYIEFITALVKIEFPLLENKTNFKNLEQKNE